MDVRAEKMKMMQYLDPFGATDINASQIYDARGTKLRILFTVTEQAKALELYKGISGSRHFNDTDQVIKIFYLKTEPEFEKYADEEAKEFFEKEAVRTEERKAANA